jgi:hypothetical protein
VTTFNLAIDAFGILLSIRSLIVLGAGSPWMSAGWAGAILYFALLFLRNLRGTQAGVLNEYAIVAFVAVVWIVSIARDERQAEPWWWPRGRGPTRAERGKTK